MEDVLAAGAMARGLAERGGFELVDDSAVLAAGAWDRVAGDPEGGAAVVAALHWSKGGRNLARVGLSGDVEVAARVDSVGVVPELVEGVLRPGRP